MTALLVACGAIAREVIAARDQRGWDAKVLALPAQLHNTPKEIPGAVERRITENGVRFEPIVVVYGDCGTGGELERLLEARSWIGLSGPHCYSIYTGERKFDELMQSEPGTFFLTDYLVGSFDHLILEDLGLNRYPELKDDYFAHYRRIVYLQQRRDEKLVAKARKAAKALGLPLQVHYTGTRNLESEIETLLMQQSSPTRCSN